MTFWLLCSFAGKKCKWNASAVVRCCYSTRMIERKIIKKKPHRIKKVLHFSGELLGSADLVFALADGLKETVFCAVERQTPWEKDEENDSTAPHVHRFTIRLSLYHLRGHEVRGSHSAWGDKDRRGSRRGVEGRTDHPSVIQAFRNFFIPKNVFVFL